MMIVLGPSDVYSLHPLPWAEGVRSIPAPYLQEDISEV